jgi:hypothetical protein
MHNNVFEKILLQGIQHSQMQLLAFCVSTFHTQAAKKEKQDNDLETLAGQISRSASHETHAHVNRKKLSPTCCCWLVKTSLIFGACCFAARRSQRAVHPVSLINRHQVQTLPPHQVTSLVGFAKLSTLFNGVKGARIQTRSLSTSSCGIEALTIVWKEKA